MPELKKDGTVDAFVSLVRDDSIVTETMLRNILPSNPENTSRFLRGLLNANPPDLLVHAVAAELFKSGALHRLSPVTVRRRGVLLMGVSTRILMSQRPASSSSRAGVEGVRGGFAGQLFAFAL